MSDFNPAGLAESMVEEYMVANGWPGSVDAAVQRLDEQIGEYADSACTYDSTCEEIVSRYRNRYSGEADELCGERTYSWDQGLDGIRCAAYAMARAAIYAAVRERCSEIDDQVDEAIGDMDTSDWVESVHYSDLEFMEDWPFNPYTETPGRMPFRSLSEGVEEEFGVFKWDDPAADMRKLFVKMECGLYAYYRGLIPQEDDDEV